MNAARAALQDQLYPLAQAQAEQAMRRATDPATQAQALLLLLEALTGQERHDEVVRALDAHAAMAREGGGDPAAWAYWRAHALLALGEARAALRVAEAARPAVDSLYAGALARLTARARLAAGDLDAALALHAEIDQGATNLNARASNALEWAQALNQAGRTEEAIGALRMQAELGVQDRSVDEGALLRGRLLMASGRAADAAMVLHQLAMNDRAHEIARVQALVEMSVFAMNGGQTAEAIAYARSAFERATLAETRRLAGYRLGDLLSLDAQTIDEGETIIKALVREFPEYPASVRAHLKLADALLQAGHPERAAAEYRIFLETYPSTAVDGQALQGRGWALFKLGRYAEASDMFQRAAARTADPDARAESLFKQGDALLADGRHGEAAQVYARLAEENPGHALAARALYQSADALERAGNLEGAAAGYRRVADLHPGGDIAPRALLRLAALHAQSDRPDDALPVYADILNRFRDLPVRGDALMGRGRVHYRAYRFDDAMQDFATVSEMDPQRRDEARFMLTLCLYGLGRDVEARASASSFLLEFPESPRLPDMMLWLGTFDFNQGRHHDARRFFLDYVTRWPTFAWADAALLWAARALFGAADYSGAVELVARLVREYPKSPRLAEARLLQADALMELARFDEAALLLEQVAAQAPGSAWAAEARLRKGDALFAMGADNPRRYREAYEVFQEALLQPDLAPALRLHLQFKSGRCLEKMNQLDEAIRHYYAEVMVRYLEERAAGVWFDDETTGLFVRAAFSAAELYERQGLFEQAASVLQRVVQAGVPGEDKARERMDRLRHRRF